MKQTLQTELSKLLREQEQLLQEQKENGGEYCHALKRNDEEVWALRNKYACGSTWGKDAAFDKWWVKQVAKARKLNIIRQILIATAVISVAEWLFYSSWSNDQWIKAHPDTEEVEPNDIPIGSVTKTVDGHTYIWTESDNPQIGWHWGKKN